MDDDQALAALGDAVVRSGRTSGTLVVDVRGEPGRIAFDDGGDCACPIDADAVRAIASACGMVEGGRAEVRPSRMHRTWRVEATLLPGGPGGSRVLGSMRFALVVARRPTAREAAIRTVRSGPAMPLASMIAFGTCAAALGRPPAQLAWWFVIPSFALAVMAVAAWVRDEDR